MNESSQSDPLTLSPLLATVAAKNVLGLAAVQYAGLGVVALGVDFLL